MGDSANDRITRLTSLETTHTKPCAFKHFDRLDTDPANAATVPKYYKQEFNST